MNSIDIGIHECVIVREIALKLVISEDNLNLYMLLFNFISRNLKEAKVCILRILTIWTKKCTNAVHCLLNYLSQLVKVTDYLADNDIKSESVSFIQGSISIFVSNVIIYSPTDKNLSLNKNKLLELIRNRISIEKYKNNLFSFLGKSEKLLSSIHFTRNKILCDESYIDDITETEELIQKEIYEFYLKTKSDVKIPEKTEELIKIQKMEIEQLRQNLKLEGIEIMDRLNSEIDELTEEKKNLITKVNELQEQNDTRENEISELKYCQSILMQDKTDLVKKLENINDNCVNYDSSDHRLTTSYQLNHINIKNIATENTCLITQIDLNSLNIKSSPTDIEMKLIQIEEELNKSIDKNNRLERFIVQQNQKYETQISNEAQRKDIEIENIKLQVTQLDMQKNILINYLKSIKDTNLNRLYEEIEKNKFNILCGKKENNT